MRIPSGKVDQNIFFVAVDVADLKTRETGLTGFTVYRCRNGGAATIYTTPTIAECSAANMPGVYTLLLDEDTTIAAGSDSEEYTVHITHASMSPITRSIELYRRDTTTGRTLDVSAGGEAGLDWANIGSPTTAQNLSGTNIDVDQIVAGVSGAVGSVAGAVGSVTGSVGGNVVGSVGSLTGLNPATVHADLDDIQTRLPASLVSGRMDSSVGAIAANAITAASINTAALNGKGDWNIGKTGYALSSAAIQAIWDALTSALTTVGSIGKLLVDNVNATISSRSTYAGGDTTGTTTLLTRVVGTLSAGTHNPQSGDSFALANGVNGFVATKADTVAIKTKTDQLAFTVAGQVDANALSGGGLSAAATRAAIGLVSANLDTQLDALPTSAELATALGTADDATLAAIAVLQTNLDAVPTADENADALLTRDWTGITGEASRSMLNALRFIRNKFSTTATPGNVTIYKEDDTTVAYTKTITTDPSADPVVEG
jgi:hypothetical protein